MFSRCGAGGRTCIKFNGSNLANNCLIVSVSKSCNQHLETTAFLLVEIHTAHFTNLLVAVIHPISHLLDSRWALQAIYAAALCIIRRVPSATAVECMSTKQIR